MANAQLVNDVDLQRPIPQNDVALLRTMIGGERHLPLPAKIVEQYWPRKRLYDRLGMTCVPPEGLVEVVMASGVLAFVPPELPWVIREVEAGNVKHDTTIAVKWRGTYQRALFRNLTADRKSANVQIAGNPYERTVRVEDCREWNDK